MSALGRWFAARLRLPHHELDGGWPPLKRDLLWPDTNEPIVVLGRIPDSEPHPDYPVVRATLPVVMELETFYVPEAHDPAN